MLQSLVLVAALSAPAQAVDHSPYQQVLSTHVSSSGKVDYAAIKASGALDAYLAGLAGASLPAGKGEQLALWINAYNALTIDLVADEWPISSIMDLDGGKVWDTRSFTVAGQQLTLNDIEHKRIRPIGDGRIHAAVNCASMGCPPLQRTVFQGSSIEAQLDAAAEAWIAGNGVVVDTAAGTARFNRIFDWYSEDFVTEGEDPPGLSGKLAEAAAWAARHADEATAAWLKAGGYQASWSSYDWSVNAR